MKHFSDHSDTLDNISYSLVKETFETGKEFSQKEVAELTQLPLKIVCRLIEQMTAAGEIQKKGLNKFIINRNHSFFLCVKVGAEKVDCIVFDSTYSVAARTSREKPESDLLNLLVEIVDDIRAERNLACIAIGIQASVKDGIVYNAGGKKLDLKAQLEQKYSVPVFIEKEINLVCYGNISEKQIQFLDDEYSVCLNISKTGVHCGLIYKTEVLTGFQGRAGEIGLADISGKNPLSEALKFINAVFSPKTVIVYNAPENAEPEVKPGTGSEQNIVFASDYEAKCEKGFVYLIKKRTSIFC